MSYVYNLADTNYKTNVFYNSTSWTIPQGINMISIMAIGAGGGGAGGATNTSANGRSGGGGGGSGALTRIIIPTICITDTLVINIGVGGSGGASGGGSGGNGGNTYVDMQGPNNQVIQTFLLVASGGTGAVGANGGAGGVAASVANSIYSQLGLWSIASGQLGGNGSFTNATPGVAYGILGLPVSGGGGGGGMFGGTTSPTLGAPVVGSGFVPTVAGGTFGSLINGNAGLFSITPFYSLGGSGGGGGGNTPNSGGRGGNGAIGSGGGGGGAGTSPTGVGGVGGRGGDGLVIIQCW